MNHTPSTILRYCLSVRIAQGHSLSSIAKGAGLNRSQLHRFVSREAELSTKNFDIICGYLGLRMEVPEKLQKHPRGKKLEEFE